MSFFIWIVDKCANCDENAACVNGRCKCKAGFIGNGYECIKGMWFTREFNHVLLWKNQYVNRNNEWIYMNKIC